ncbi:MAG: calcium-binding protein, partial [Symploca sp. SIO3E6]|nr:calcium-binding protein [Caldora sp. SIO3E6]
FNQGIDRVYSSISYSLGANLENLTLTGSAYYGYGNSLNNSISGNGYSNYLWGGSGNDSLYGNGGNDTLSGSYGDDYLNGGTGNDYLIGGAGSDRIVGGFGHDILTGGTEADQFFFSSVSEGIDTITDFTQLQGDKIQVSASGFGGGLTLGVLATDLFTLGSGATDASDRFIYNSATGALSFDADGSGSLAQVQFATLSTGLNLTSSDILVVA